MATLGITLMMVFSLSTGVSKEVTEPALVAQREIVSGPVAGLSTRVESSTQSSYEDFKAALKEGRLTLPGEIVEDVGLKLPL